MVMFIQDIIVPMWQRETKLQHQYQYQNLSKNIYETVKRHTNRVMDRSGCPATMWFLTLVDVCYYLNNCVDPNVGGSTNLPL